MRKFSFFWSKSGDLGLKHRCKDFVDVGNPSFLKGILKMESDEKLRKISTV